VAAIQTRAVADGDDYLINGSKMWITSGTQSDYLTLLARTSDERGFRGMSLIIVPTDTPGFSVSRKLEKLGNHSSDTAILLRQTCACRKATASALKAWAFCCK
jgi:citronellyl-CoA dehydrogenase